MDYISFRKFAQIADWTKHVDIQEINLSFEKICLFQVVYKIIFYDRLRCV